MVQYTIYKADKAGQGYVFLIAANVEEMTRRLPLREEILSGEASDCVATRNLGVAFAAFLEERLDWSNTQLRRRRKATAKPTPAPTDHQRGGGGEGKYGRMVKRNSADQVVPGQLAKPMQWWFGKEVRCGSHHQPHGTLPQSGRIPGS
jgi:hypothetical protein